MHPTDETLDESEHIPPCSPHPHREDEDEDNDNDEIDLMDISMSMNLASCSSSPLRDYTVTHSPKSKSRLDNENDRK